MRSNNEQSIKHENQLIDISDRKRTRESISTDSSNYQQPNKRKRQSMKAKEEPKDIEMIVNVNTYQPRKSNNQPNNPRKKKSKAPNNVKGHFKCTTCKEVLKSSNQLRKHQRTHTGERPNECDICYKSFDQPIELEMHKMIHSGKKPYKCDLCSKAFFESFRLESHRKSHFRERLFECDICQMRLFNSNDLESHRRIHNLEML